VAFFISRGGAVPFDDQNAAHRSLLASALFCAAFPPSNACVFIDAAPSSDFFGTNVHALIAS